MLVTHHAKRGYFVGVLGMHKSITTVFFNCITIYKLDTNISSFSTIRNNFKLSLYVCDGRPYVQVEKKTLCIINYISHLSRRVKIFNAILYYGY